MPKEACSRTGLGFFVFFFFETHFVSVKNSNLALCHQHKNTQIKPGIAMLCNIDIAEQCLKNDASLYGLD